MNNASSQITHAECIETAHRIGSILAREAIWDGDDCNWIGGALGIVHNQYKIVEKSCPSSIYHGTSGIAIFLASLFAKTRDPIFSETLNGCINQIIKYRSNDNMASNLSFFEGHLGVAYSLIKIGDQFNNKAWSKKGWKILESISGKNNKSEQLDIMGIAGAIPILVGLHLSSGKNWLIDWAITLGNHLIDLAQKHKDHWSWITIDPKVPMSGYSHGSSGIALAFLHLYKITGQDHFNNAFVMGFNHERKVYDPKIRNWPDLRNQGSNTINYGESWCYGAPGIVISKIRAWELTGDEKIKTEAIIAADTTYNICRTQLSRPASNTNFSLCHGLAGNADILLYAAYKLGKNDYRDLAYYIGKQGYERYHKTKLYWPGGLSDPSDQQRHPLSVPGFMMGSAGTGYFYLRLSDPQGEPFRLLIE